MFTTLSVFGVFLATQFLKKYITPKFGDTGVHVFAFIVAVVILSVKGLMTTYPPIMTLVTQAGQFLVGSLALYQIVYKPLNANLNIFPSSTGTSTTLPS